MNLEAIWYECSPFVYFGAGVASVITAPSALSIVCAVMLIAASMTIVRMRWVHRHTPRGTVSWPTRMAARRARKSAPKQRMEFR